MQDKKLHEFISRKLSGYEVPYEGAHWDQMAERLKSGRTGKGGADNNYPGLFLLVLAFSLGLFQLFTRPTSEKLSSHIVENPGKNTNEIQISENNFTVTSPVVAAPAKCIPNRSAALTRLSQKKPGPSRDESGGVLSASAEHDKPYLSKLTAKPPQRWIMPEPNYRTLLIEHKIRLDILSKKIWDDSTTYKVFKRNLDNWKNVVIVCDWTSSMFKYGTQVLSWLAGPRNTENVKGFVFFNDCDSTGRALKVSDQPGQMFTAKSTKTSEVLQTMIEAARKGKANEDLQENDLEAIKYAGEQFPEAEIIVLIADNVSPVRDMEMIKSIKKPVKVIVCGTTLNTKIALQPDYFTIAQKTEGSIHTIEDDLVRLNNIKAGRWIKIGDIYYKYRNKVFKPTRKKHRPR
ncbi:hypothetical protein QQ020_08600 [Fulvivirgaceae bacterium BMA12]|uniref:VWFA domain-containing protein n=1 Tax=Agaribacillus aureus TaxID=3051825 RepID=A0ABT8L301_9BACT|nr:hypothetical protein [Fulvivirgaceae bacterium BMA12]